jgi:hypothetical protein
MARKLQTVEPSRLAKVARDVIWYQQRGLANTAGLQLLNRGTSGLGAWLVAQRGIGRARAGRRMWGRVGNRFAYYRKESLMGNVKKWRKKKIAKHKHRKRRKRDRWQRRKR